MSLTPFERRLETRARKVCDRIDVHGSFDGWHTHVDWKHEVGRSKVRREAELRVLFRLHDRLAAELSARAGPWQLWIVVFQSRPGEDLIEIRTPCESQTSSFPRIETACDWRCGVPDWLSPHATRPAFDIGRGERMRSPYFVLQRSGVGTARVRPRR